MYNRLFFDAGGHLQVRSGDGNSTLVRFPVCLAIKYGNEVPELCPNFILNIEESWVLIPADFPLPEGASVLVHFYIPPENKLLAEVEGRVRACGGSNVYCPSGTLLDLSPRSHTELESLGKFIEGSKPLIDKKA